MAARRVGAALGLAAAAWCAPAAAPVIPLLARSFRIPTRLPGGRGIALTFDDGPHPDGTPAVLEALERAGARATFFLVGEQVERWPSLVGEIAAAGHEIGVHGYRHIFLLRRSPRAVADDFARAEDAIGRSAEWYRPPYGVFSAAALAQSRRRGWKPLLWSRWGRDWERRMTPERIAATASANLIAGDVVLLHDADHYSSPGSWSRTAAALPLIIEAAGATGEPLVSVSHST